MLSASKETKYIASMYRSECMTSIINACRLDTKEATEEAVQVRSLDVMHASHNLSIVPWVAFPAC